MNINLPFMNQVDDRVPEYGLPYFFRTYFGADWYSGPDLRPPVEDYLNEQAGRTDEDGRIVLDQIDLLLGGGLTDEQFEHLLYEWWRSEGGTVAGESWQDLLREIRRLIVDIRHVTSS